MARHIVDSVLQLTSAISLSVAALFWGLEKAFDCAVREVVMGYPSHVGFDPISRRAHLENVGFPPVVVREILRVSENRPPLLEEWGVSAKATRLIAALHSGSRFRYGECPSVAETGASWGVQSSMSCLLKLSCVCKTSSWKKGFWQGWFVLANPSTLKAVTPALLC